MIPVDRRIPRGERITGIADLIRAANDQAVAAGMALECGDTAKAQQRIRAARTYYQDTLRSLADLRVAVTRGTERRAA